MGRYSGVVSILVLAVAVKFSILAFAAPLWLKGFTLPKISTNQTAFGTLTAGVWGYCVTATTNTTIEDACYGFYLTNHKPERDANAQQPYIERPVQVVMSKIFLPLDTRQGVCDALNSGRDDALQPFVDISGLDASAYKKFLTNSCGTLGNVSFISAIIAMVLGFIAFICLVVFIVCVENIQPMVNFIKWLSVLAGLASLVAVIAWVYQIDPLVVQGFYRGISFVIEIIACQLFMLSAVLVHYHSKDKPKDFK